jgi:hypothetical protein
MAHPDTIQYDYAQDFEAYFAANRRQVAEEIDNLNRKRAELGGVSHRRNAAVSARSDEFVS